MENTEKSINTAMSNINLKLVEKVKEISENVKARIYADRFNIWTERVDKNRKADLRIFGEFLYNGTLYYGNRFLFFFKSAHNSWYKGFKHLNNNQNN